MRIKPRPAGSIAASALLATAAAVAALMAPGAACAQLSLLVAVEPSSKQEAATVSHAALQTSLGKALGQTVAVTTSEDLADAMRASRSAGYDVFIAPAQVAASALQHGYELVGATTHAERYVLIGRDRIKTTRELKGQRIYLPQQDSIYTYMARGMLNADGLSLKDLGSVQYGRYPQAGLTAVTLTVADTTVILRTEWEDWSKDHPGQARVLAVSSPVPGGLSVVIKKSLPADLRSKISKWFVVSSSAAGMKPLDTNFELAQYRAVAELGLFTPTSLPGATLVSADDVKRLQAAGAVVVDTRTEKEYQTRHIPGAVFVPYHEKSLKDVAFNAQLDDFAGVDQLDKSKPTVFSCNGAECWKSYKASRAAVTKGFKQVYWFRGGLPEWEQSQRPDQAALMN